MKKKESRDCDPDLRPACHAPAPAADARSDFGVALCCRSFAEYRSSLQPSAGLKRAFARSFRACSARVYCRGRRAGAVK